MLSNGCVGNVSTFDVSLPFFDVDVSGYVYITFNADMTISNIRVDGISRRLYV
jgi:hypothetical protein